MKKKEIIKIEQVEGKILMLRGVRVIIDADVAALYGVETREINQAVKNNLKKFPKGYVIELETNDLEILRSKILIAKLNPKSRYHPQAFTERGLYMLATILKLNEEDYIGLTDIARIQNPFEPKDVVKNWMRQKNTIEYLGLWEKLYNPDFKGVEFDPLLKQAARQMS